MVCGAKRASVIIDTATTTLRAFVERVVRGHLGFSNPSLDNKESLYLEADDISNALWDAFLSSLPGGGIQDGTVVSILDLDQDLRALGGRGRVYRVQDLRTMKSLLIAEIELDVVHRPREAFDELKHPEYFEVFGDVAGARAAIADLDKEKVALESKALAPSSVLIDSALAGQKRRREDESADSDASDDVVIV